MYMCRNIESMPMKKRLVLGFLLKIFFKIFTDETAQNITPGVSLVSGDVLATYFHSADLMKIPIDAQRSETASQTIIFLP